MLTAIIVLLFQSNYYEPSLDVSARTSQDMLDVMQELRVEELDDAWVQEHIDNASIFDPSISVLDQLGQFWAENDSTSATQLFTVAMGDVIDDFDNIALRAESDELFRTGSAEYTTLAASSRLITGIEEGQATTGSSSSAYLKNVRNKKTSSYVYFGGYVGQGDIQVELDLPNDFTPSSFISSELKLETPGNFSIEINGITCGSTYQGIDGEVVIWSLDACNASLQNNQNTIDLEFNSALNESAISGGFLKITYTTDELKEEDTQGFLRYDFPGIEGFINLYDSFSVQGQISSYFANITLYNEYDTFLTIANETVLYIPGRNETQTVVFSANNLSLLPTQIPLRLGTTNLSNITVITDGVATNSFLVTDVSGSMDDCGSYTEEDQMYCQYQYGNSFWNYYQSVACPYTGSCNANECGVSAWWINDYKNHFTYNITTTECSQTLMEIAQVADKLFVETVLGNSSLNEIGLVDFSSNANSPSPLTNVQGTLNSEIDTYSPGGGTCTCCGINRAKDLLLASDDDEKFMVVLSDGEPTMYCNGFSDYTGSNGDGAESRQDAIDSGQHACANNITVYTIGFGESMSATGQSIMQQTACNSSLYYDATNVDDLAQIYEDIANDILLVANYTSQTIDISGNFSEATLSPESYIDIEFTPLVEEDTTGKLSVVFETEQFNSCDATISIPEGLTVTDAVVTSFSSNQWTKSLLVNGISVFNLTSYASNYPTLGDPFLVQVPAVLLNEGQDNTFSLEIGDSPTNSTACSANNTLIYTALIDSVTPRSSTYENFQGCSWSIESENDRLFAFSVPSDYTGGLNCSYTSSAINYKSNDAYDVATYQLLEQLDPDENGKIIVDLAETDLEITITIVSGVPYLWGPSVVSVESWIE